ncbi:MAG: uroporphyrinogen decarboxylase family protein [Candidatus Zipacnadales bacterium]
MSYERGWKAIHLEMPDRIPHTEYISHRQFIIKVTGIDPEGPEGQKAGPALAKALDFDFIWSTYGRDWGLPSSHMGRAKYYETETPFHAHYAFRTVEEVLSFDPLAAAKLPSMEELTADVRRSWENGQQAYADAVFPGGFYNTVFTWPIITFGWELFMQAAMDDPERFDRVIEGFTEISMMVVQAHIRAEIPIFLCHDDIVWASGTVFAPTWMRKYVFPRHKRLWDPLREAGIKVLFCSDGNFDEYVDDLAQAGAEGFIFEPLTNLNYIVEKYGQTHVIIGNIDSRVLQYGTPEAIRAEVKRCADLGKACPGYFFAVGNHIPYTVPIPNVECYLEAIDQYGRR